MSNRAAYNFLSSISLGGNQTTKKEPTPTATPTQPQQSQEKHHPHREHFKAKLTSTLEKKHALLHRHDKTQPTSNPLTPSTSSSNLPTVTANKPAVHPNSLKRSTSNISISSEYNNNSNNSYAVVRSTSGNAIQSRDRDREPSPRDKSSYSPGVSDNLVKSRNNSVDQGPAKIRESGDYGIVRKGSDPHAVTKGRTNSTDQGNHKHISEYSSSSFVYSTRSRGESVDYSGRETRRPSEPITKSDKRNESISVGSKEYRKLSKSTNDAGRGVMPISGKPKYSSRSQEKLLVTPTKLDRIKESRSPLRVIIPDSDELPEEPIRLKRHRRKKSKSKKSKADKPKTKPIKNNPAALDFLKGISLGENTPVLRKRRTSGKSKLSEVYPKNQEVANRRDEILFVGSSSTKKIKIADYSAQVVPGKLYLSTRSNSTFAVFSVIKYDAKASKKEKEKNALKESAIGTIGKLKSVTNAPILTNAPKNEAQEVDDELEYDPYFLDDPSLTTGKHRTVMNLPCFKESIIPYVRPGVIKDELNELFRQKHPWVPSGVTLHKIRKLKKALVVISVAGGLEISTVAIAYTLLEKLILKGLVTKPLIRLYGAVCLVLAAKSNDPIGGELKPTMEAIEKQLHVEKKEVLEYEFPVFAAFSCSLLLPPDQVIPHIRLIIKDHQDLVGNPY